MNKNKLSGNGEREKSEDGYVVDGVRENMFPMIEMLTA
jgi:hypothetical protein